MNKNSVRAHLLGAQMVQQLAGESSSGCRRPTGCCGHDGPGFPPGFCGSGWPVKPWFQTQSCQGLLFGADNQKIQRFHLKQHDFYTNSVILYITVSNNNSNNMGTQINLFFTGPKNTPNVIFIILSSLIWVGNNAFIINYNSQTINSTIRTGTSALFREAPSSSTIAVLMETTVLQNSFTNLASNDRWINDKLNDLVEQLVQEADAGIQQGPFECHHAGL